MATRWMTAGAVLAICASGCSSEKETPPSEPLSVPKQVSETDEPPKSPFKPVESQVIEDMQPTVVASDGFKRLEPQPVELTAPATPMNRAPESSVSTTRPVEPPAEPKAEEDDEKSSDEDDERKRRRRRSGGSGGPGIGVASPFGFGGGGFSGGSGFGTGGLAAGFGDDAVALPDFGSDSFGGAEDFGSGDPGSSPSGYDSGISLYGSPDDYDVVGDDLAETTDGFGPPPRSDDDAGPGAGHGGPADGGLSAAPPVPPPDF